MKKISVLLIFAIPFFATSQSLSPDRVEKIKSSVVRIVIDSSTSTGTGFFINEKGQVLTCWHVIEPALIRDSLLRIVRLKRVFIEFPNGERREMGFATVLLQKGNLSAVSNDYCVLMPLSVITEKFTFFKFGDFDQTNEGQEIYTCGYPFGMKQQFISKGIISTKFIDTSNSVIFNGKRIPMPRAEALLDLTLNRGNSGGPIIKIGASAQEDEIIGIADFIINPFGGAAERLYQSVAPNSDRGDVYIMGISQNETTMLYSEFIANASNGISGCVSTNHFLNDTKNLQ